MEPFYAYIVPVPAPGVNPPGYPAHPIYNPVFPAHPIAPGGPPPTATPPI
jgi:hypothetical protein